MDAAPGRFRHRRRAVAVLAALALSACGGGLYIGIGNGWGDSPPSVSLVAGVNAAAPGQTVRLSAAASDDYGIDYVAFYRLRADGSALLLGSDGTAPFQWDATMPDTTAGSVQFFARAVDGAGQSRDSELVSVAVVR